MHPAKSLILFTSASGLGFGLLIFLCMGFPAVSGWVAFVFFALAFVLSVGGLLASTLHLGHPERALKAFSQWRTSWLSREGWLACATLCTAGLYAALLIFAGLRVLPLGWIAALLCVATIYATSMIYAQLKTVPRWNHWTTSALFMALALTGGALLSGAVMLALPLLAISFALQFSVWKLGDTRFAESGTTLASATGLGKIGTVRAFEPPHTGGNYLTKEMVFVIARKHALKLRSIGLALAFVAPFLLLLLPFTHFFALIAILAHVAGLLVLRWLFFAEAEHVVGLYYGRT